MKKISELFILTVFFAFTVGCSNADEEDNSGVDEVQEAAIREELKTRGLMKELCKIDSLEDGTLKYTPCIGVAIESSRPTVYYTTANTMKEARQIFQGIISPVYVGQEEIPEVNEVRQGNIHLTFSESAESGETAIIIVDCPELNNVLTEIVFIPEEKWPTNDFASPFTLLSGWRNKRDGRIFVCVETPQRENGIMLTFDAKEGQDLSKEINDGYYQDWFKKYDHWQGQFFLWKNTASDKALDALAKVLTYNRDKYKNLLDRMDSIGVKSGLWKKLYNLESGSTAYSFLGKYTYTTGLWRFYHCYYIDTKVRTIRRKNDGYDLDTHYEHFDHDCTPIVYNPSYSFEFNFHYKVDNDEWARFFKGT